MDVDECVAHLKRFLEEGHIPGLTPSDELLARFREKCTEEFNKLRKMGPERYLSTLPRVEGSRRKKPKGPMGILPCVFTFFLLCRELEEKRLLKMPAAGAYELFDEWLREQLGSER